MVNIDKATTVEWLLAEVERIRTLAYFDDDAIRNARSRERMKLEWSVRAGRRYNPRKIVNVVPDPKYL